MGQPSARYQPTAPRPSQFFAPLALAARAAHVHSRGWPRRTSPTAHTAPSPARTILNASCPLRRQHPLGQPAPRRHRNRPILRRNARRQAGPNPGANIRWGTAMPPARRQPHRAAAPKKTERLALGCPGCPRLSAGLAAPNVAVRTHPPVTGRTIPNDSCPLRRQHPLGQGAAEGADG